MQKALLQEMEKGERLKGKGNIQNLSPTSAASLLFIGEYCAYWEIGNTLTLCLVFPETFSTPLKHPIPVTTGMIVTAAFLRAGIIELPYQTVVKPLLSCTQLKTLLVINLTVVVQRKFWGHKMSIFAGLFLM
ncbi:hypothetical protein FDUTEX481_09878 [Tolypothrix sp. PCC 7601]|nr:hypothetical protein FDUTEX481_09878 [Tolypothrix sp. PCC 7601]